MKIYFLRHTSLKVGSDIFYGQTDLDVSGSFLSELKVVKKKFLKEKIDVGNLEVYSSPLKRCMKLTKKISDNFRVDNRLKELNLGDWEMKKMKTIPKEEIFKWEENLMTYKIPNGESNKDFLLRLKSFLKDVIKLKKDVLIVAHAGSINGMISNLTNEPFDKLVKNYWEKIGFGSLSLIEKNGGQSRIRFIGK